MSTEKTCQGRGGDGKPNPIEVDQLFSFKKVGAREIKRAIHNMENKTSVGTDGIPITVIKQALPVLVMVLAKLANAIISKSKWPREWKCATVIPTPKKGKPKNLLSSLRPISLLCAISKLMEAILEDQFSSYVEENVLPDQQHAYREGRSVDTAISMTAFYLEEFKSKGLKRIGSAFDYSSAFDTMDPELLLEMFAPFMDSRSLDLLGDYFNGATQLVKWNDSYSNELPVRYGVRQGSILGPTLFITFISQVYKYCLDGLENAAMIGYADDNNGLVGTPKTEAPEEKTELLTARLVAFSARHGLALNASKTQIMAPPNTTEIRAGDTNITPGPTLEVLNTVFEYSGRFTQQNEIIAKDLTRRVGQVRRLTPHIPRGRLLREIGNALVIGKANCTSWVTREARLSKPTTPKQHVGQVALNDLARVLTGHTRREHIPISQLTSKANVPTFNEIIVKRASVEAWKAVNGGALKHLLELPSSSTRATNMGLVRSRNDALACLNMRNCWNASPALREAKTIGAAKRAAKLLASEVRNY